MGIVSATNQITGVTYQNGVAVPKPGVLQSTSYARMVNVISEGVIQGLADQANPLKSIYFAGTPVQDPTSGTFNFQGVKVTANTGTATQAYIPGFSAAENPVAVSTTLVHATPLVRTTTTSSVDAVRVTIQYPQGLQNVDSKGRSNPTTVNITIETKLTSSGTWTTVFSNEATYGKAEPNYQKDYYIPRPSGTGTWDVRVTRVTADSATPNTLINGTMWYEMTEIQDVQQAYVNSALVDLTYDAKNAPSPFPITFDAYGILCSVPSNYNPTTRVYTGVWDGTFTSTKVWTDNPAYHLYEILTNTRWGMGNFISASQLDLSSFYAAGVYNDGGITYDLSGNYVSGGVPNGSGGYEPRFRFNCQISSDEDAWKFIQTFASTFNSMVLVSVSGLISIVQDRPTSSTVLVTNDMIAANGFQYSDGAASSRPTSTRVSYNDVNDNWTLKEIVETDTSTSFPFLQTSVSAWGCTSEGQARRIAKWNNDTNLRNTRIVSYRAPLHHLNVAPGTVITVADSVAAGISDGGKVLSVSGTTVNLDRPITVTSGTNTLMIRLQDGITLATATITNTAGTYSTVTISATLPQAVTPGADFLLSNTIAPQTYRVTDVKEVTDDTGYWFDVTAIQYDPTKYARIETGVSVPAPVYFSSQGEKIVPGAVTGLTYVLQAASAIDTVTRDLKVSWTAGTNNDHYYVQWRKSGDTWAEVQNVGQTSFLITNVQQGQYDINVYGISPYGVQSPVCSGSYGVDFTGTTTPVINAVTNLIAVGGGTTFTTPDLSVQWTNPTSNANLNPALKDFVVNVYTTGGTLLRTEVIDPVAPGASATYTYTFTKNLADNANVPIRSVRIDVIARDGLNNLVTATSQTFTNAAPAAPTGVSVTGGIGNIVVSLTLPTDIDYKGILVWASLTNGFTPSSANLVYDGSSSLLMIKQLGSGVHYLKIASYDTFGKDYAGAGLNVSSQFSATPLASAGIPSYASTPGAGAEGDFYYNTTDGQLYRYHSGAWTTAVPAVSITGTIGTTQIAANAVTAAKTAIAAIDPASGNLVANSVTSAQIVAGTIVGSDIAATTITGSNMVANTITAGQIAANTITGGNIAANTITGGNIAANTITAGKILAATITSNEIAANTIVGNNIAANTIVGNNIAANAITTPCINGGAVCQVRNTYFNQATNNTFTVYSQVGYNVTQVWPIVQTSSYTTYCYGAREINLVGFAGSWVYTYTGVSGNASSSGLWHNALYVRRVVNGVATVIWSTDYQAPNAWVGAQGTSNPPPTTVAGLAQTITILDDTSLGSPGTAITLYYDVCFATTQTQSYTPTNNSNTVGVSFTALPYTGMRFISMVEYQK